LNCFFHLAPEGHTGESNEDKKEKLIDFFQEQLDEENDEWEKCLN